MDKSLQTIHEIDKICVARSLECSTSDLEKYIHIKKHDLTIISQNIRSIYHNFDDLLLTLSSFKFSTDVIVLTECRLNSNKPIPTLNNYNSYTTTCHMNQNDGVVVYIKSTLKPKIKEIHLAQASCLQIDVLNNIILCVYRSPSNTNTDGFIDSLDTYLNTLTSQKSIIITGDININIKAKTTELSYDFKNRINYLNMLSSHGILPGHNLPTREKNCLDHFMLKINQKKVSATIAILCTSITDHYTTFLTLTKVKNNIIPNKTSTTVDYNKALKHLQENNLKKLLLYEDPNLLTIKFIQILINSINKSKTTKVISSSQRIIKPWITPGILRCIKNRNNLQNKTRRDPFNVMLKITYIRYRNYCNNLLKKLKRQYERELLAKSVKDNKLLWKNIKSITYCNKTRDNSTELLNLKESPIESTNYANNYFVNIGRDLALKIKATDKSRNNRFLPAQPNSFVLLDTDENEVERILMSLKSDSSPGWDDISTRFLKHVKSEVIPIITHLANICFKKGIFPDHLKKSTITPIYKGGDREEMSNYRPISILPAISKIIEKLLNVRILKYLNKFNLLSPNQFGFRQSKSCEDAVTFLTSSVINKLDKGQKCLTIFLDLMKAFDTVSIPDLLYKLESFGIRGTPLDLFKDYLSNRKQRVKLSQYTSDDMNISYGVPQGSVLGPTLFLVYINDLCNLKIKNAQIISYADDTAITFTGTTWHETKESAELGMIQIVDWLNNNLLTLNTLKTKYICFSISNHTQPLEDYHIRVHNCHNINNCTCPTINKVTQIKYLGVVVDQRLSWHPHIEHVNSRIAKLNWIFRTLRHVVPRNITDPMCQNKLLNDIYIALVQSVLAYCITIWGGAVKTKLIQLERAQRGLIKTMYFKKRKYSTERLYQLSNLLSVRKLYILQSILKKHREITVDTNSLTKRRKDIVAQVPQVKTSFANMQYNRRAAQIYNKINKKISIYKKTYYECKKELIRYLQPLTYEEIESLVQA